MLRYANINITNLNGGLMVSSTISLPNQRRGWFDLMDDWLKRVRFVFIGWSGLLW